MRLLQTKRVATWIMGREQEEFVEEMVTYNKQAGAINNILPTNVSGSLAPKFRPAPQVLQ